MQPCLEKLHSRECLSDNLFSCIFLVFISWCFFVRLFGLCLFGFVGFLFLLGSGCEGVEVGAAVCDCGTPWTFLLPFFFFYK